MNEIIIPPPVAIFLLCDDLLFGSAYMPSFKAINLYKSVDIIVRKKLSVKSSIYGE